MENALVPGNKYYLKWVGKNPANFIVLECEFIKYYDNRFYENVKSVFQNSHNFYSNLFTQNSGFTLDQIRQQQEELRNRMLENDVYEIMPDGKVEYKEHPFDNPLYPYKSLLTMKKIINYQKLGKEYGNIGLFKFLRVVKVALKRINFTKEYSYKPINFDNLLNNIQGPKKTRLKVHSPDYNAFYNDVDSLISSIYPESGELIPDEMFWADLSNFQIKEANVSQRIIHQKTLKQLEPKLNRDVVGETAHFVGSKEYVDDLYKGGRKTRKTASKNRKKTRKNRRKTHKNKTKGKKI